MFADCAGARQINSDLAIIYYGGLITWVYSIPPAGSILAPHFKVTKITNAFSRQKR